MDLQQMIFFYIHSQKTDSPTYVQKSLIFGNPGLLQEVAMEHVTKLLKKVVTNEMMRSKK